MQSVSIWTVVKFLLCWLCALSFEWFSNYCPIIFGPLKWINGQCIEMYVIPTPSMDVNTLKKYPVSFKVQCAGGQSQKNRTCTTVWIQSALDSVSSEVNPGFTAKKISLRYLMLTCVLRFAKQCLNLTAPIRPCCILLLACMPWRFGRK